MKGFRTKQFARDLKSVGAVSMTNHSVARRTFIKGASLGFGTGLAAHVVSASAETSAAAPTAPRDVQSSEYWAHKGGVKLSLFRKRMGVKVSNAEPLPVLFLVHGSSLSARSSYDLQVPGANTR